MDRSNWKHVKLVIVFEIVFYQSKTILDTLVRQWTQTICNHSMLSTTIGPSLTMIRGQCFWSTHDGHSADCNDNWTTNMKLSDHAQQLLDSNLMACRLHYLYTVLLVATQALLSENIHGIHDMTDNFLILKIDFLLNLPFYDFLVGNQKKESC